MNVFVEERKVSIFILIPVVVGFTILMLFSVVKPVDAATSCGPGPHWVDGCTAGTDGPFPWNIIEFGVDYIGLDGIPEFDAIFVGPGTIVERTDALDDSLNYPGLRPVDGHFDVIDTEIVSMNLVGTGGVTGWTFLAGVDDGLIDPTYGSIAEQIGNPFWVDSFFDVMFKIEGTPFGTLHNNDPLRVESVLDRVPPELSGGGTDYGGILPPIGYLELYNASGAHVANLTDLTSGETGHHTITPEPISSILFVTGGVVLAGRRYLRRKRT